MLVCEVVMCWAASAWFSILFYSPQPTVGVLVLTGRFGVHFSALDLQLVKTLVDVVVSRPRRGARSETGTTGWIPAFRLDVRRPPPALPICLIRLTYILILLYRGTS
jgi:hypothetical protein